MSRILYIVDRFPVYSETFISDEIKSHIAAGLDVQIAVLQGPASGDYLLDKLPDELRRRLVFLDSPAGSDLRALLRFVAFASPALLRLSSRVPKALSLGLSARELLLGGVLASRFSEVGLIHCHYGNIGRIGLAAQTFMGGRPALCITFHAHDLTKRWFLPLDRYYRPLFRSNALLLSISRNWCDLLLRAGAPTSRTIVHRLGVDWPEERISPRNDVCQIVMIGRLVEKKGHKYAISALADLKARGLGFALTVIGGGPLEVDLQEQVRRLGLEEQVTFKGPLPHAEALKSLRSADLLLLPSVTAQNGDMEGIPVVLMEAMASGVPVISTRHSAIPELITDGETGLLVQERDADELGTAIAKLIADPALRMHLAKGGREKISADFNHEKQTTALRRLYEAQIEQGR